MSNPSAGDRCTAYTDNILSLSCRYLQRAEHRTDVFYQWSVQVPYILQMAPINRKIIYITYYLTVCTSTPITINHFSASGDPNRVLLLLFIQNPRLYIIGPFIDYNINSILTYIQILIRCTNTRYKFFFQKCICKWYFKIYFLRV